MQPGATPRNLVQPKSPLRKTNPIHERDLDGPRFPRCPKMCRKLPECAGMFHRDECAKRTHFARRDALFMTGEGFTPDERRISEAQTLTGDHGVWLTSTSPCGGGSTIETCSAQKLS